MKARMKISLLGVTFTDALLSNVGSGAFILDHDFFSRQDLAIRTAAGGGGVLLVEDVDYTIGGEDTGLSFRMTAAVGAGRNVINTITILTVGYQSGNLYFSGKYIADGLDPTRIPSSLTMATNWADILGQTLPPFVPIPLHMGLLSAMVTARVSSTTTSTSSGHLVDSAGNFVVNGVVAGDYIYNSADNKWGRVTVRNSATDLSVDNDVFPTGKVYKIFPVATLPPNVKPCDGTAIADSESPLNGVKLPDLNGQGPYADSAISGGRFLRGGATAGVEMECQEQGHLHGPGGGALSFLMNLAGAGVASGGNFAAVINTGSPVTDGPNGTPRTGKETRGRSISMIYVMRIK